jgi:hypothetical protein
LRSNQLGQGIFFLSALRFWSMKTVNSLRIKEVTSPDTVWLCSGFAGSWLWMTKALGISSAWHTLVRATIRKFKISGIREHWHLSCFSPDRTLNRRSAVFRLGSQVYWSG